MILVKVMEMVDVLNMGEAEEEGGGAAYSDYANDEEQGGSSIFGAGGGGGGGAGTSGSGEDLRQGRPGGDWGSYTSGAGGSLVASSNPGHAGTNRLFGCGEAVAEVEGIEAVEMEAYLGEAEAVLRE